MKGNLEGRRVLVVEDEYFLADDLAQALTEAGAAVAGPAQTLDKAMALLGAEHIDLAVIDINLKGRTGFEIADALSERGVFFVFATGYDAGIVPDRHRDVPRWEKPYSAAELVQSLERGGKTG